jgi:hypothetical protein
MPDFVDAREIFEKVKREAEAEGGGFLSFAPFTMDPKKGLFITVERRRGKEEWQEDIWLSAPFEITGRIRDPQSHGWARLLCWKDDDKVFHQYPVADQDLHGDGAALCASLANGGLKIATGSIRQHFVSYLNQAAIKARVTIVPRTGWQVVDEKKIFALPAEGIGIDDRIILAAEVTASHYTSYGTLQEWQNSVAKLAAAHGRARFAIASAFVSPLLALMGADGGGINLKGPSSIGKTSSLVLHRFGGVVMNAVSSEHGVALATVSRRLQLNSPTLFCRSTKSALPAVMRLAMSSTRLLAE